MANHPHLSSRRQERPVPFFLYLPFHAPHTPLDERGPFPYSNRKSTTGAVYTPWQYPMTIGARNDRGNIIAHLNGCIDDVRVYDRVLTDAEIQALAAMPPSSPGSTIIVR